jgi:hypothetical protein
VATAMESGKRRFWAGYGTGKTCDACDLSTTKTDIEYEADMADGRTFLFLTGRSLESVPETILSRIRALRSPCCCPINALLPQRGWCGESGLA